VAWCACLVVFFLVVCLVVCLVCVYVLGSVCLECVLNTCPWCVCKSIVFFVLHFRCSFVLSMDELERERSVAEQIEELRSEIVAPSTRYASTRYVFNEEEK